MNILFKQKNKLQEYIIALSSTNNGVASFKQNVEESFQELQVEMIQKQFNQAYLQEQEQQPANSIQTAPFNTFINKFIDHGAQKSKNSSKNTPQLAIMTYNYVYGFNKGINTVEVINGKICRAVGVNIFLDGEIYPIQGDTKKIQIHNYSICYLKYHKNLNILQSCSYGKSGQIIHWKVTSHGQNIYLTFIRKFLLPLNSQQIIFTHLAQQYLICITNYSMHQQSDLFLFNLQTNKRLRLNKVGKVLNLLVGESIFLVNQKGLNTLQIKDDSQELVNIYQPNSIIMASSILNSQYIILGLSNSIIELFLPKQNKTCVSYQLKGDNISLSIKSVTKTQFISLQINNIIVLYQINFTEYKINTLHNITLQQKSIRIFLLFDQNTIFSCNNSGRIQKFKLDNNKITSYKDDQPDISYYKDNDKDTEQLLILKSDKKRMYYGFKHSNMFNVMEINKKCQISKVTLIKLKYKVLIADFYNTFIAYITRQTINKQEESMSESHIANIRSSKLLKGVQYRYHLIIQDYLINKLIYNVRLSIDSQCTEIKYSPDGQKLALGFENGKIHIYGINLSSKITKLCSNIEQSLQMYNHTRNIQSIIWSKDSKYLKTISYDNLLFYGLVNNNKQQYQLLLYHNNKKMAQNESVNAGVSKAQWTQMGKYSWKTVKLWKRANYINQYKCVKQSMNYIFGCNQNGDMQIFNNPTLQKQSSLLKRWYYGSFKCQIIQLEVNKICLILYGQGILFSINLQQFQEVLQ